MPDDNNLLVPVDGDQAVIGTDVYSSGGETAHAQVMKVAWGDQNTVNRANTNSPLPVKVYGMSGPFDTITVTGAVRGLGTFTIGNTSGSPVHVTGGVNSFVYGVVGATPVAVTGAVNILSAIGITGVVNITGGRYLNSTTDSVIVGGTVARNWNLTNLNDNVTVYGFGGATFLSSKIMGSDGTVIGNSGGALNVNVIGAGISANVSIGAVVGVQNATGGVLRIEGTANGTPVPVSLSSLPTIFLNDSGANTTTNPLYVDLVPTPVTIGSQFTGYEGLNGIQKLLIANKLGGTVLHTTGQWLSFLWDSLGEKNSTVGGTIQDKLSKIVNGEAAVKSRIDVANNVSGAEVKVWNLNGYISPTNPIGIMTSARTGYMYINNNENVDILLTTEKYFIDKLGFCATSGILCETGVSNSGGDITFTAEAYNSYMANGGYLLKAGTSAFLPIKFNRYILIPSGSVTTGTLTVIIS